MAGVASILLAWAAQAAAAAGAPPGAEEMPAQAVDHVAVVEQAAMHGYLARRREIIRSGTWLREARFAPDERGTSYSDFASGATFRIGLNPLGAVLSVSASRHRPGGYYFQTRRTATGRRDTALGEDCAIWSLVRIGDAEGEGIEVQVCETADGIQLWRRALSRRNGTLLSEERATSFERRPVRPEEVRPPADLFALAPWPRGAAVPAPDVPGYEVRLTSRSRGAVQEQILRRHGPLWSGQRDSDGGTRQYWARDAVSRFSYSAEPDGRPLELAVSRLGPGPRLVELGPPRWQRVGGRAPRTVLRERCTWQEDASVRSTDIHYTCRTADEIPLMLEDDWHWDSVTDIWVARSLVRRAWAPGDFAPPAAATDWASWGVAPPP